MRGLPAEERKNLILDQAQRLFVERGFAATTVEDILNRAGIAKGTLYHHFSGKEDIMRQLIARTTNVMRQKAEAAASSDAHPLEKFAEIVASARVQGEEAEMIEQLHHVENTDFHVLTMTRAIVALAPLLASAVQEGVDQGVFSTPDPVGDCRIILTAGFMLPDHGLFPEWDAGEQLVQVVTAAERLLGCEPGAIAASMHATSVNRTQVNTTAEKG